MEISSNCSQLSRKAIITAIVILVQLWSIKLLLPRMSGSTSSGVQLAQDLSQTNALSGADGSGGNDSPGSPETDRVYNGDKIPESKLLTNHGAHNNHNNHNSHHTHEWSRPSDSFDQPDPNSPDTYTVPPARKLGPPWTDPNRPLITYAYHESAVARDNLLFFVRKGLYPGADFIFIINGPTEDVQLIPSDLANVRVVERDNTCFDLGSFGEVLRKDGLWRRYRRFVTLNASVRGPFYPIWAGSGPGRCWPDMFLSRLSPRVKLVGTTVNCLPRPHVQSMLFATDAAGMALLLDRALQVTWRGGVADGFGGAASPVAFAACYASMPEAIHAEVGSTTLIRSQGYEVDALMAPLHAYGNVDEYCAAEDGAEGDVLRNDEYYGFNVHPYEVLFFKSNRNVDPAMLEHMTKWHLERQESSWEICGGGGEGDGFA